MASCSPFDRTKDAFGRFGHPPLGNSPVAVVRYAPGSSVACQVSGGGSGTAPLTAKPRIRLAPGEPATALGVGRGVVELVVVVES